MTVDIEVDGREFSFPAGWTVSKFDDWAYYKSQIQKQAPGYKAVDILAISPDRVLYLIEVKDYTIPGSGKPSELPALVAKKVMDTLSALIPGALHANNSLEKKVANEARGCRGIRVIFHCELSRAHTALVDKGDLLQKLKPLIRAVDPHPVVTDSASASVPWKVAATRAPSS